MRNLVFKVLLGLSLFSFCAMSAQDTPKEPGKEPEVVPKKRYVRKFKTITDPYYGFPNFFAIIFKPLATLSGATGVSVSSIGPTGAKSEFMVTDKFSIGVDANYSNVTVSFSKTSGDSGSQHTYHYKVSSPAFRSMASFTFHNGEKQKLDFYTSFKIGYYSRSIKFETDDSSFKPPSLKWPFNLAVRIETGFHYFPSRFFGFHGNFGFGGGAMFNLGVSSLI